MIDLLGGALLVSKKRIDELVAEARENSPRNDRKTAPGRKARAVKGRKRK